jgi:branched-chain amino acid transport system permease protein
MIDQYTITLFTFVGINILLALSVGLLNGYVGQISIGHAGFYAVGAYTAAVLTTKLGFSFWTSLPLCMIVTGIVGAGLGVISLRLRDDFLAITTIGFNFIVVGYFLYSPYFGGALGMGNIPIPSLFGKEMTSIQYFIMTSLFVILVYLFLSWLTKSWIGLAWFAIRENQDIAAVMGINTTKFKVAGFIISTMIAGLAGCLYAHFILFITPYDFPFALSASFIAMAALGGLGTLRGPVLGAIIVTVVPEYFRFIQNYRLLIYGLILIIVLIFEPQGILGNQSLLWKKIKKINMKSITRSVKHGQ